jgi:hypothetical protein
LVGTAPNAEQSALLGFTQDRDDDPARPDSETTWDEMREAK